MKHFFSYTILTLVLLSHTVRIEAAPAIDDLKKLASEGDNNAMLALGMAYRDGNGIEKNYEEALKWYRKSADQGNASGLDNVGFMHLRGRGVPENFDIAAAYFKASAKQNFAQGLFNLGNCYFSGQGVEQNYAQAIAAWDQAAQQGHSSSTWRLATLLAAGEGIPRDPAKAKQLCKSLAQQGHTDSMLLLGELCTKQGNHKEAQQWWKKATKQGSKQADALLKLSQWRHEKLVAKTSAYVEVDHLYQGWNNCGATSVTMFARFFGSDTTPYHVKRLCPRSPIGTGTDWADLVAAGNQIKQPWEMITFANNDEGFSKGSKQIQQHLDDNRPVVIDFTVTRKTGNKTEYFGHTLLVVGYNTQLDQYILKNPNQPPPGIEIMSAEELKSNWYSRGYSRLAKGQAARPLIVIQEGS